MNLINETPFAYAPFMGKVIYPKDTLTIIVKGTFRLKADAPAELLPDGEQLLPTGDQFYDDDPLTSCRYESDFVHFKPKADVFVVGHCHVPNGIARPACTASFSLDEMSKTLMVFGKREWVRSRIGTRSMSEPEAFRSMALRYENSFGGPDYSHNPIGKGIRPKNGKAGASDHQVPNIRVLEGEQLKTMGAGAPAGFGPLGRNWSQRMASVGTYGKKWLNERWPWLPEDFDWNYYNAAPPDQQIKGYLRGDEPLSFENMHPEHRRLNSSLPGVRVRCFAAEKHDNDLLFREVRTHLDTLWVDMDNGTLILVWRGLATVDSPKADPIEELLIVKESVSETPKDLAYYEALFNTRRAAAEPLTPVAEGDEAEEDAPNSDAAAATAAGAAEKEPKAAAQLEAALQQVMAQARGMLATAGLDTQLVSALKAETDPEQFLETLVGGMGIDPRAAGTVKAHSQKQFKEMLGRHRPGVEELLAEQGHKPAAVDAAEAFLFKDQQPEPPSSLEAEELAEAARSGGDMADQDMNGADFSGMLLEGANFREAQLEGVNFRHARLTGASFRRANLEGALFEGADLTGADLNAADLNRARLSGACLRQVDLADAVLTEANLIEADLSGALLCRAQLNAANLIDARLSGTDLTHADLSNADLTRANLSAAVLHYCLLNGANLTQAKLREAGGQFVSLMEANLTEADVSLAQLEDCDFSGCRCDFAKFEETKLDRTTFERATGRQVSLQRSMLNQVRAGEGVSLPQSSFRHAAGAKSNWAGADLSGSDLILAEMPGCDFSDTNMSGCDCRTAELKQSIFDRAILAGARFNRANLFQTRMEKADLTGANFKGCNLYGSEFLNATISDTTNFSEANLQRTKLSDFKT